MTDDLVQRLRRTYRKEYAPTRSMCGDNSNKPFPFPILATEVPVNPDGHEAADRIEALTAEVEELREHLSGALETLRDAGVCDDKCSLCNEAFAALEKQP